MSGGGTWYYVDNNTGQCLQYGSPPQTKPGPPPFPQVHSPDSFQMAPNGYPSYAPSYAQPFMQPVVYAYPQYGYPSPAMPYYMTPDKGPIPTMTNTMQIRGSPQTLGSAVSDNRQIVVAGSQTNQSMKPDTVERECSVITVKVVMDILRDQQQKGNLCDSDRRGLQHIITVIEELTEKAGSAIWRDARITFEGVDIIVKIKSGDKTNQFEVRLDGQDNPYYKTKKSGFRLKFWNGVHNFWGKAKEVLSLVAGIFKPLGGLLRIGGSNNLAIKET